MKCLVLLCVVAGVMAEPPRFRPARFRFQRIELAPTTTDSPTEPTTESAPYPASGWKPSGTAFNPAKQEASPTDVYGPPAPYPASGWKPDGPQLVLPQQQSPPATSYGVPDDSYGAPQNTYGAPQNTYGAPQNTYGAPQNTYGAPQNTYGAPTDAPTTDNPQAEKLDGPVEVQKSMGEYYVLLPNGQLQRVEFATENDVQNMKYTARLQLRSPAPLFVFGP